MTGTETNSAARSDGELPNVLLVILDSVRASELDLYGYERETAPSLSSFADTATVYEQARAPGIHSVASHASIWTGDDVAQHGLTRHEDRLASGTTVWEWLDEQGYETGLFTTNVVVTQSSNLAAPFGTVVTDEITDTTEKVYPDAFGPTDVRTHEGLLGNFSRIATASSPPKALVNSVYHAFRRVRPENGRSLDSSDLVDRFEEWRDEQSGPWAACLNLMDAHYPYEPAPRHDRWADDRLRAMQSDHSSPPSHEYTHGRPWWELEAARHLYDGAIRQVDAVLDRLVGVVGQAGALDETLVVVTSDHGEGFGEYSRLEPAVRLVDHSWGIHEALTHVPLVVDYPGREGGDRVSDPVSLSAFPDVVADAVDGKSTPSSFVTDGPVLSSTYRLLEDDLDLFADSDLDGQPYAGPWHAVYEPADDGVRKHARHGEESASFLVRDAQVSYPVEADAAGRVEAVLDSLPSSDVKTDDSGVDAAVEERLGELGYIR